MLRANSSFGCIDRPICRAISDADFPWLPLPTLPGASGSLSSGHPPGPPCEGEVGTGKLARPHPPSVRSAMPGAYPTPSRTGVRRV